MGVEGDEVAPRPDELYETVKLPKFFDKSGVRMEAKVLPVSSFKKWICPR